MTKSTIIIPNYNGIKYIEACLESIFTGTAKNVHVVVVDNASKDGSLELIKDKFPQVELIENKENEGFCKAVNQGIKASRTPYCILLNNDTRVDIAFVHELEKAVEKNVKIFSAGARMISLHDKDKLDDAGDLYCALGWAFARGKGKNPAQYDKDCEVFACCGGASIYRRDLLEELGYFDENHFAYFEDIDIGYRALINGYKNVYASNAVVYHAGSATSGSRYNTFKTRYASRNSVYLIYKNMPLAQIIINLPFLLVGYVVKFLFFAKKGMGKDYANGVVEGLRLCADSKGKAHKIPYKACNFKNYVKIQINLWKNLFKLVY